MLERVSPTLGESLRRCFLQVAFASDSRFRFLHRPSIASALGTVAHEVTEAASRGRFAGLCDLEKAETFDSDWQSAISRAQLALSAGWPLAPIPLPSRWRGYELVRTRLRRLVIDQPHHGDLPHSAGAIAVGPATVEAWLGEPSGRLYGRADRVETAADGSIEIVDLKTGWLLADEMKPEHRRQILTYAYLWHAETGTWPARASIERLDGSRLTIQVAPSEAEEVAHSLLAEVDRFNAAVTTMHSAAELARPGPDTCEFCPFRAVCQPFFSAVRNEWGWYRRAALGRVAGVTSVAGSAVVELDVESSSLADDASGARLLGVPESFVPPPGTKIAVVDATPARSQADMRVAWDSQLVEWD